MTYHIAWHDQGTVVDLTGTISIDEINEANGRLHGDARVENHEYSVWNFLEADLSQVSEQDILVPAAIDRAASISIRRIKVAFVAVADSHAINILLHYVNAAERDIENWEFGIFGSTKDAMDWIEAH